MAEPLLNVNQVMSSMKAEIDTINRCSVKVGEISDSVKLYETNKVANISTIITTIFMIVCAIMQTSPVLLGVAAVLAVGTLVFFSKKGGGSNAAVMLSVSIVATQLLAVICFMIAYQVTFALFIPLISCLVMWIATIYSNYKMKNLAWSISNNL